MASTLITEEFSACSGVPAPRRQYEVFMRLALDSYSRALKQAKDFESDGRTLPEENGGSAHGSTEVLYRLHATRLKCHIAALCHCEDERNEAEVEALRLTEANWYLPPASEARSLRDRIWLVVADVVAALAQCRLSQPFFHRSVYRHAQALMWAPVLHNPVSERAIGSLGTVPATKAFQLRGLNNATSAAESAAVVVNSLFDKKRAQLCAVWLTTGSSTPFQMINKAVRKFDSLRGKYVKGETWLAAACNRYVVFH
jgi:hypothetical protein